MARRCKPHMLCFSSAGGYEADGLLEVHSRVTCELLDHLKGESVVCRQLQLQV